MNDKPEEKFKNKRPTEAANGWALLRFGIGPDRIRMTIFVMFYNSVMLFHNR